MLKAIPTSQIDAKHNIFKKGQTVVDLVRRTTPPLLLESYINHKILTDHRAMRRVVGLR